MAILQRVSDSAATLAKQRAIEAQLNALDAEGYRITLMHSTGSDKKTINVGKEKGPDGSEKFYEEDEIKKLVPYLSANNANGYNVYITPIDSKRYYIVVDDLDLEKAHQFWAWGYRPALIQKSSQHSIQAVSILPKADVTHGAGNVLFKKLNRAIGDEKISGFVHPFRLAGFTNRKPSRRMADGMSPFVLLLRAEHRIDEKAVAQARSIDEEMKRDAKAAKAPLVSDVPLTREQAGAADIAANRSWYQRRLDFWDDKADRSRIDRQLARRLRSQGYTEGAAQEIIRAVSPDIESRHPRLDAYLQSKTADLYQQPAEQKPETPRPAPGGSPRPKLR